ncbi:hypothetical protein QL919_08025 [Psychrobacter sp. APC 3426]|uniref:hypothetical protein n=1 Tax=Psychrobacter sp. APC 3426 TaxID=3035177 RepID=UPI0025B4B4B7|nr:hypothetical protein [Psychrobacter sp. APC 3426]MDN3398671.1 hypothetical protein [Psychrobacter sp. APC 3426]
MKPNLFNHTLLAVGVAALMGVSTGAMATTESGAVSTGAAGIKNIATAKYKVGNDTEFQPEVESNEVIVNISETANFSLVATSDDVVDEKNEDIAATPNTTTEFNHILANNGNVTDTYTIETTGNNSNIATKDPDYALGVADIDYAIDVSGLTQAEKDDLVAQNAASGLSISGNTATGTIPNDSTITLLPGLEAELSYQAATGDQTGGNIGVGTLKATSTFITAAEPAKAELINENQTIVTVPVFKIEKSAICQSKTNCNSLDLNSADTDIDYSIKVTNVKTDYSVEADNFVIRDVLPKGMKLNGDVTLPSGATVVTTGTDADGRQIIDVTVPSLAVAADLTVSFKVEIEVDVLRAAGSATNHATVYDSYDDTTPNPDDPNSYDITDSTDDTLDSPNVPEDGDGPGTPGEDTTPTITFTDRDISITDADNQEVAVKGEVTYTHTITNEGNENEGGTDRPITITLTDPDTSNALSIDKTNNVPYYSTDGGTTKAPLTDNGDGTYTIPDSVTLVPNEAADGETPTTGSTVEIGYTVISDGTNDDIDVTDETNTVTVTPGGDLAPTVPDVTNTTEIQGLKLVKLAAVVSADGNQGLTCPTGTGLDSLSFSDGTTAINAEPFDCIVYKVTATNTFTTKDLTDVTISDAKSQWEAQSTYQDDLKGLIGTSDAGVTDSGAGAIITTKFDTLPISSDGTMTFSIKVNP